MSLTAKQEAFCKNIVAGMGNKAAYQAAYNSTSEMAAWNESAKLLLREDIQNRIKSLSKPIEDAFQQQSVNARQQQIDFIKERIIICKQKEDEQSIIRYTDMLNKIHGIYKEETDTNTQKPALSEVSNETLLKLVSGE